MTYRTTSSIGDPSTIFMLVVVPGVIFLISDFSFTNMGKLMVLVGTLFLFESLRKNKYPFVEIKGDILTYRYFFSKLGWSIPISSIIEIGPKLRTVGHDFPFLWQSTYTRGFLLKTYDGKFYRIHYDLDLPLDFLEDIKKMNPAIITSSKKHGYNYLGHATNKINSEYDKSILWIKILILAIPLGLFIAILNYIARM